MTSGAINNLGSPGFVGAVCKRCTLIFMIELGVGKMRLYCDFCKKKVVNGHKRGWSDRNKDRERQIKSAYKKQPHARKAEYERMAEWRKTPEGKAKTRQLLRLRYSTLRNSANILKIDKQAKSEVDRIYEEAARTGMTVDHIYPLKHKLVSGLHVPWNLRLVTLSENSRKSNKLPHEVGINLE